jgi:hypothetical protein
MKIGAARYQYRSMGPSVFDPQMPQFRPCVGSWTLVVALESIMEELDRRKRETLVAVSLCTAPLISRELKHGQYVWKAMAGPRSRSRPSSVAMVAWGGWRLNAIATRRGRAYLSTLSATARHALL